ncbi:hypothetical protein SALBM311S_10885 [Streptomyces alboniger]
MRVNTGLRTVTSPYDDGETFVAMPALRMDAALVHMSRADRQGNGQYSVLTRTSTTCSARRRTPRTCPASGSWTRPS